MQSAIAETHTLELRTHRPCTQSPEKVNLDNSRSKNNQSNNIQRLTLDRLETQLELKFKLETSGRQSVLVSPPEYSTIHHYKVWLESGLE